MAGSVEDVRELIRLMKSERVRRLALGDIEIELEPGASVGYKAGPPAKREDVEDSKAAATADDATKSERDDESAYLRHWRRITRSSGAPIPPYPGPGNWRA